MATVYLHIGLHKTGTTALQYFLAQNNSVLNQHGICFPDLGVHYANINFKRNGHFLIAPLLGTEGKHTEVWPGDYYESALDDVQKLAKTYDKIILSDEAIWQRSGFRGDHFWSKIKEDFNKRGLDVRIIAYVRRQDLWIQSYWKQRVKVGSTRTFPAYVKRVRDAGFYPLDYCAYMDMLSAVFGKESLIIRVYEKGQYQGPEHTLHSDFLDIFGLTLSDGFVIRQEVYNTSLDGSSIELRRILNGIPEVNDKDHVLKDSVAEILKANGFSVPPVRYSLFAPGEQKAFLDYYSESNSRLAKEYLGREDGVLFYDKLTELPEGTEDERGLLRDTILLAGQAVSLLEHENRQLKKQLHSLKKSHSALEKEFYALREDVLLYRLKRKKQHLLGEDKPKKK